MPLDERRRKPAGSQRSPLRHKQAYLVVRISQDDLRYNERSLKTSSSTRKLWLGSVDPRRVRERKLPVLKIARHKASRKQTAGHQYIARQMPPDLTVVLVASELDIPFCWNPEDSTFPIHTSSDVGHSASQTKITNEWQPTVGVALGSVRVECWKDVPMDKKNVQTHGMLCLGRNECKLFEPRPTDADTSWYQAGLSYRIRGMSDRLVNSGIASRDLPGG
ncbi:hypothetical protein FA13DRAFT_1706192 [Coprinellus micaceus]|uniref:Uncharacterized protein n=1 Tax=Coprinellus micaceus TaxID=71717 RepID=A0A4Y7TS73_COPMI|nr:hypothetical protein FA13DRAFT_1706192 [Coprinellus micaceus]